MPNRLISLLTVTILYAASVIAEEQNTIYIQSDNIVPYQEGTPATNLPAAPPTVAVTENKAPFRVESPAPASNAAVADQTPSATYDQFVPFTAAAPVTAEAKPAPVVIEAPTQTHLWLKLQSSGAIAGTHYTTPGQTATQIHQRYLKSFTHPIPERFNRESGGSGAGSSSFR